MEVIKVDVALEIGDFTRFKRYFIKRKILNDILVGFLLFIDILVFEFSSVGDQPNKPVQAVTLIVGVAIFALMVYGIRYFQVRKIFENNKYISRLNTYTFSEEEIKAESQDANMKIQWDEIYFASFKKRAVHVFTALNKRFIIPYRCFDNQGEIDQLKELMRNKLGSKKLKIKKDKKQKTGTEV